MVSQLFVQTSIVVKSMAAKSFLTALIQSCENGASTKDQEEDDVLAEMV